MIKIASNGGIGNRLRTMIGYAAVYKTMGKQLPIFIWKNTKHAPPNRGAYRIKGTEIIDVDELDDDTIMTPGLISIPLMYRTHDLGNPDEETVLNAYRLIDFSDAVKTRASTVYSLACHLRMTDMASAARLNRFRLLLASASRSGPVYLACDDRDIVRDLMENFDIVSNAEFLDIPSSLRTTSIFDAAVDMLTCVNARQFVGTRESSYSHMIALLRMCRGLRHATSCL